MTLIKACDLALGYDGKTVAENISFTVNEGDYLCVIGENGSGKRLFACPQPAPQTRLGRLSG